MPTSSKIIADSISPAGTRLTSFVLEFPRWILAEVNTHRMLSKNAASSRAIPIEKMIQRIIEDPATPSMYGKNQSGMQSHEELQGEELEKAKVAWLKARDRAIESAKELSALGLHKQYVNRTIENFMHVRIILSGTEYENFFALRAHVDAQPEFRQLAYLMLEDYNKSIPNLLKEGQWHIPFGSDIDFNRLGSLNFVKQEAENLDKMGYCGDYTSDYVARQEAIKKIAVARCARVSYLNFEGKDDYSEDIKLCDRLFGSTPRHLSPTEHVAMALSKPDRLGNFTGFKQYRYFFNDQNLRDSRIKRHEVIK